MRIEKDQVEEKIADISFLLQGVLTICTITTEDDYYFVGMSACIDPESYDADLGQTLAYENAMEKMMDAEAYLAVVLEGKPSEYYPPVNKYLPDPELEARVKVLETRNESQSNTIEEYTTELRKVKGQLEEQRIRRMDSLMVRAGTTCRC